jgi:hypothetical protein
MLGKLLRCSWGGAFSALVLFSCGAHDHADYKPCDLSNLHGAVSSYCDHLGLQ